MLIEVGMIKLEIELDDKKALALAQFLKRLSFTEYRVNAVDESEAYLIRDACSEVQDALARQGFNPR